MLFIGFLILLLLIPVAMIRSLISEREARRHSAVEDISSKWGDAQVINGPFLTLPYLTYTQDDGNRERMKREYAQFLPNTLFITAEIEPEIRHRGIFDVVVYEVSLIFRGEYTLLSFDDLKIQPKDILWDEASMSVGIPDMRGINESVTLQWNGTSCSFLPGVMDTQLLRSGIHSHIADLKSTITEKNSFEFQLTLNGSESLAFIPLGQETRVEVTSSWSDPSFFGAYLPSFYTINKDDGFDAVWIVSYFSRSYPQYWKSVQTDFASLADSILASSFGTKLLLTVDNYKKTERSVKYAILFIALTFVLFFLFEIMNRLRIHPFQYLLIGFAMGLFYLLLLSLSEHMNFLYAYAISSIGTTTLISGYSMSILQQKRRSILIALLLFLLYGFLYILLQLEDYALLFGSVALFFGLGLIMYITRKIDWYAVRLDRSTKDKKDGS